MGHLGLINPSDSADAEYSVSIRLSAPLVSKIEVQSHETWLLKRTHVQNRGAIP